MSEQISPWVIVSSLAKETTEEDIERIKPKIQSLVDKWQESGKIMWSGSFNNQPSSMAVFEATNNEAKIFYKEYSGTEIELDDGRFLVVPYADVLAKLVETEAI